MPLSFQIGCIVRDFFAVTVARDPSATLLSSTPPHFSRATALQDQGSLGFAPPKHKGTALTDRLSRAAVKNAKPVST
eukprot:m.127952 g.127952  ORF g.127952 m.127952 type:complete len:77 (-) comp13615_c0_seq3:106-336(-)